jgi:hypothetical protein
MPDGETIGNAPNEETWLVWLFIFCGLGPFADEKEKERARRAAPHKEHRELLTMQKHAKAARALGALSDPDTTVAAEALRMLFTKTLWFLRTKDAGLRACQEAMAEMQRIAGPDKDAVKEVLKKLEARQEQATQEAGEFVSAIDWKALIEAARECAKSEY